jgi:TPR repeat protein
MLISVQQSTADYYAVFLLSHCHTLQLSLCSQFQFYVLLPSLTRTILSVRQQQAAAFAWFCRAASLGHVESMYNVARRLATGTGVEKSDGQAVLWLEKASKLGHTAAMCNLGWCLSNGVGVLKDLNAAAQWCVLLTVRI